VAERSSIVTASVDSARRDEFAERMLGILNGGALSLMISIGHRSGLFDVMGRTSFATSEELADSAGLNERYVREWLGAMVAGAIVEFEPAGRRYRLPPEHAASLTRDARPNNLAATAQWVPLLASVEDDVLTCFERGGGVPYESFHRFHEVMAEESDQTVVAALCESILPLVPGLVARLETGIDVVDVGCGSGRALNRMAHAYPKSRFTGFDVSEDAVAAGSTEAEERGLKNVRFEVRDATRLGPEEAYDLVTAFDAIHDQARPAEVLAAIARALRPDGVFLMQDIRGTSKVEEDARHPLGAFLYTVSCLHCMTVSLAASGAGLGAMWGVETARRMLDDAGFADLEVETLPHDVMNFYYVARKST
jgi:SAM-dependent methyltransferase